MTDNEFLIKMELIEDMMLGKKAVCALCVSHKLKTYKPFCSAGASSLI